MALKEKSVVAQFVAFLFNFAPSYAIAHGPARALREAVFVPEKYFHEFRKSFPVVSHPLHDLHGLIFGMFFKNCFA